MSVHAALIIRGAILKNYALNDGGRSRDTRSDVFVNEGRKEGSGV